MRHLLLLSFLAPCLAFSTGCAGGSSYVRSNTTLGRIVVYRNGIAYFERTAHVEGDTLKIAVPADKVDDFLKSLSVVDAKSGDPAPVAYPTAQQSSETGLIDMKITLPGASPHDLRLSYVTESPSWKPNYRIVLGKQGKVTLQAAAIIDNTSGEDWEDVEIGVGSSAALSFRFDLRSVRLVQRETLRSDDLFAQAPPMGGPAYAQMNNDKKVQVQSRMAFDLGDDVLANANVAREEAQKIKDGAKRAPAAPPMPVQQAPMGGRGKGSFKADVSNYARGAAAGAAKPMEPPPQPMPPPPPQDQLGSLARQIQSSNKSFVVEGYADHNDADKHAASLERANRAREQLIRNGVDPSRVVAIGAGEKAGRKGGVSVQEAIASAEVEKPRTEVQLPAQAVGSEPIGSSHFTSRVAMSVPRGSSAKVSILNTDTEGEVVYFYDAESPRGNSTYPFRAVRIKNPTDSALESGPVTVFGEGKFIGEGMSEPIPASSVAFIPFALDRQVVVEKKGGERDRISRIITVQRGVFSTEVQHSKTSTLTFNNRLADKVTVYVKHTVAEGYKLTKGPEKRDKLGAAYLFRVDVEPNAKAELEIEESTPLFKSTDIRSNAGMEQVTAYLSAAAVEGPLKTAVNDLLKLHKDMANIEQHIQTTRDQMGEYRARMDELHAQIVTLKAVKTAGPLMQNLEKKLAEVSDKLSKATIDLVAQQEKLMVARIKFQDGVSDLTLEKKPEPAPTKS